MSAERLVELQLALRLPSARRRAVITDRQQIIHEDDPHFPVLTPLIINAFASEHQQQQHRQRSTGARGACRPPNLTLTRSPSTAGIPSSTRSPQLHSTKPAQHAGRQGPLWRGGRCCSDGNAPGPSLWRPPGSSSLWAVTDQTLISAENSVANIFKTGPLRGRGPRSRETKVLLCNLPRTPR